MQSKRLYLYTEYIFMSRFYVNKIIWTLKISLDAASYTRKTDCYKEIVQ